MGTRSFAALLALIGLFSLVSAQGTGAARYGRVFSATTVRGPGLPDLVAVDPLAEGEPACHAACDARSTLCRAFAYVGPGACYLFGNCTPTAMARAVAGNNCTRGAVGNPSAAPLRTWGGVEAADLCEELAAGIVTAPRAASFTYDVQTGACRAHAGCRLANADGYRRWTVEPCQ